MMDENERRQSELFHTLETKLQMLITSVETLTFCMTTHNSTMEELKAWQREHDLSHAYQRGLSEARSGQAFSWKQVGGMFTALSVVSAVVSIGIRFLGF